LVYGVSLFALSASVLAQSLPTLTTDLPAPDLFLGISSKKLIYGF
jgi:hypothetical protein